MNETIKGWLKELYEGEIEETKGTIGNERIWANGAPDAETAAMHEENVRVEEEYLKILEEKLDELTENTSADGEGNPNWPACAALRKKA